MDIGLIYSVVTDVVDYFRDKNLEKVPIGKFMNNLEKRLEMKLSIASKYQFMAKLKSEGKLVTSRRGGHKYVIIGKILP